MNTITDTVEAHVQGKSFTLSAKVGDRMRTVKVKVETDGGTWITLRADNEDDALFTAYIYRGQRTKLEVPADKKGLLVVVYKPERPADPKSVFVTVEEFEAKGGRLEKGRELYTQKKGKLPEHYGSYDHHFTEQGTIIVRSGFGSTPMLPSLLLVAINATPTYK